MSDDLMRVITEALQTADDEAMTTAEVADALGYERQAVLAIFHKLNKRGKLLVTKKKTPRIDGTMATVTAYRLKGGD